MACVLFLCDKIDYMSSEKPLTKKDLAEFTKNELQFLCLVRILYQKKILDKNDITTMKELQLFPKAS